jgi:hypothetical protein
LWARPASTAKVLEREYHATGRSVALYSDALDQSDLRLKQKSP